MKRRRRRLVLVPPQKAVTYGSNSISRRQQQQQQWSNKKRNNNRRRIRMSSYSSSMLQKILSKSTLCYYLFYYYCCCYSCCFNLLQQTTTTIVTYSFVLESHRCKVVQNNDRIFFATNSLEKDYYRKQRQEILQNHRRRRSHQYHSNNNIEENDQSVTIMRAMASTNIQQDQQQQQQQDYLAEEEINLDWIDGHKNDEDDNVHNNNNNNNNNINNNTKFSNTETSDASDNDDAEETMLGNNDDIIEEQEQHHEEQILNSFMRKFLKSTFFPHKTTETEEEKTTTTTKVERGGLMAQRTTIRRRKTTTDGLSKFHHSLLSSTIDRQRFVTGTYPLYVTVKENPTRKWLGLTNSKNNNNNNKRNNGSSRGAVASTQILVNGTSVDRSLASYDRFSWLEDDNTNSRKELHDKNHLFSMELLAEIHVKTPAYVNILPTYGPGITSYVQRVVSEVLSQKDGDDNYYKTSPPIWDIKRRNAKRSNENKNIIDSALYNKLVEETKMTISFPSSTTTTTTTTTTATESNDSNNNIINDRLWVTGFSLTKQSGNVVSVGLSSSDSTSKSAGHIESVDKRTQNSLFWPNEINIVPKQKYDFNNYKQQQQSTNNYNDRVGKTNLTTSNSTVSRSSNTDLEDAVLICDGFLVPGRDKGGLHIVMNPGSVESEQSVCLTSTNRDKWFYHRAVWVDLTGDGRQSILTARAKRPSILNNNNNVNSEETKSNNINSLTKGQLVWLERPVPHSIDEDTGTPLEADGTKFDPFSPIHIPWKTRVLAEGPDVMFSVADLNTDDNTIEVLASEFFHRKLSLYSIERGTNPQVTFQRTIDERVGAAFGSILADLDNNDSSLAETRKVIDSGSTVTTLQPGDSFSHILVTSHECSYDAETEEGSGNDSSDQYQIKTAQVDDVADDSVNGGSLFAYRVPSGREEWKTEPWIRSVVACGFKVKPQLSNAINPGAPGFCYTFYPKKDDQFGKTKKRPLIAVAGDCAESAYIFRPTSKIQHLVGSSLSTTSYRDANTYYSLMCEIKCGATVGSIGIGYDDFCMAEQESGYAKIYVPCYEKDKILVFAMGSGEDDYEVDDDGW